MSDAGSYTVEASSGMAALTAEPISLLVARLPAPKIDSIETIAPGAGGGGGGASTMFRLSEGQPGSVVEVYVSDDLKKWILLATVPYDTGPIRVNDPEAHTPGQPSRFYRLVAQ